MDWCIAESFDDANHNPVAVFMNDSSKAVMRLNVHSGDTVKLNAAGTHDPDGDSLSYHWFPYKELSLGTLQIEDSSSLVARFIAQLVTKPRTIHIILSVKDNGEPSLFSYRRIIITVNPR